MGNKKKLFIIGGIVTAIAITTIACVSAKNLLYKYKNDQKISAIEAKIEQGDYEEALEDIKQSDFNDTTNIYSNILKEFLDYDNLDYDIAGLTDYLNKYKDMYKDYLNAYPFYKLQGNVNSLLDELNTKKSEFNTKVEEIKKLIESEDIESSKVLLEELRNKYPKEDLIELSELLTNKESIIEQARIEAEEKAKAEKEAEEEKKNEENKSNLLNSSNDSLSNSESNSSNSSSNSENINVAITPTTQQPTIANTKAAQSSSQLITVVSKGGSYAELKLWQKDSNGGWYEYASADARLGKNGMTDSKREGDGCTPTGIYGLTEAFGIKSNPGTSLSYRTLDGSEYWVDDSNSEYYNTMQFGDANGRWSSAEYLYGVGTAYNYSIVVNYNRWSPVAGNGSAIFLHVGTGGYTAGCVSVSESMMVKTLNWINSGSNPRIIITSSYDSLYKYY